MMILMNTMHRQRSQMTANKTTSILKTAAVNARNHSGHISRTIRKFGPNSHVERNLVNDHMDNLILHHIIY